MKKAIIPNLMLAGLLVASAAQADVVDGLLAEYKGQGAGAFDASAGADLWQRQYAMTDGSKRACISCHTNEPRLPGRHAVTGRTIEPLAPSVNPRRLNERRQIAKWFKRNCKWTLGRECTPQEKGDLLSYLRNQ